jgi:hypothetical protein
VIPGPQPPNFKSLGFVALVVLGLLIVVKVFGGVF